MMASTSEPRTQENSALVEQFCSITGATKEKAQKMLEVCTWNLEMAINMHVDFDYQENDCIETDDPVKIPPENDPAVRPPIPQSRGVLVEDDIGFHYGLRGRKRRPHSVFDGFRDFQAEAQLHDYTDANSGESSETFKKKRTLEDLFRPPLDIMHRGTFETAREVGQVSNRWLMVNIQDSREFSCQVLSRDVWSNQEVKRIISKHFVFWQVYSDSIDGQRYMQFYKPVEFPYVAMIDPRTGEKLTVWQNIDATSICDLIAAFLKENNSPNGSSAGISSKFSLLDQTEEYQIKAALEASLKESAKENADENDSDLETFDSDSENTSGKVSKIAISNSDHSNDAIDVVGFSESNDKDNELSQSSWKDFLGSDDDPKTELVLRFPDGKKEQITWPCSTKVKALMIFINELGYDNEKYELVTNFPRRNLCQLDQSKTLKEVDLFPREMVFVQLKS
ncbi:LOW QUALITY PROTEIN: UBX domain-containing protein 7-like [Uloborus diversus]|uniref:LOW QUALITY PROTEIN: UBX domain-containing protein 7-like n=1 Tax=Uloborus diversus TaxID=327109 RepID=UPI00240A7A61|nr:LOW QUALITY PROTEIN: UBX domain-containing protein 7-like [Uloborus diversus]